jgi:hypothetical protein
MSYADFLDAVLSEEVSAKRAKNIMLWSRGNGHSAKRL